MVKPSLLVTGTGRCGTTWLAEVLDALGVETRHACDYSPRPTPVSSIAPQIVVSWPMAPYIDSVDAPVMLLVRNPYRVAQSLAKLYALPKPWSYTKLKRGRLCNAIARVLRMNRFIEPRAVSVIRVEDGAYTVMRVLEQAGAIRDMDHVEAVCDTIGQRVNAGERKPDFPWPDHALMTRLDRMAERYGYDRIA